MRPGDQYREFERGEIEQSIPARFDKQVRKYFHATAVRAYGRTLTYGELDAHANRIAFAVAEAAGGEPQPVLVAMHQGVMLPAAILGILKAGHFYVPIDAGSPELARIAAHTGAGVAVCDEAVHLPGLRVVDAGACTGPPAAAPASGPSSLAYIYYTSGSTGVPKGVMDSHRNVLHNVLRYTNSLKIGAGDRLTLLQTPGFSGAVSSMFCALLNGAACYPITPRDETSASLAAWVQSNHLTMWHSVPSLFRQLCASGEQFPSVRVVRLEGDQAAPGDVALFRRHFAPDSVLVNGLGATETGLTRQYFVMPGDAIPDRTLPIGYAVPDMEVVIGEDGELGVKSAFLALGYWKQPELTRTRFQDIGDGRRLYWTGDLGKMTPDGCLTLAGRKDHAVKIAGNRVDVLEVEAALSQLPGIAQAAVAAQPDGHGELRLKAWLVFQAGSRPAIAGIRRALSSRLPPHSVPSSFFAVAALPLNANGKVDRRLLIVPERGRPLTDRIYSPPRTAAEHTVARLWRDILGVDPIGLDDEFFELGAGSLDLARLASEFPFDMERFSGGLTVRGLAAWLELPRGAKGLVRIREGAVPALFCVPPHSGVLAGFHNLAGRLQPGQAVYGFAPVEIAGDGQPLMIEALAARYLELMRAAQPSGPYALCGHCFGGLVAYEMACVLQEAGEQVTLLALVECYNDRWFHTLSKGRQALLFASHATHHIRRLAARGPAQWTAMLRRAAELLGERRRQRDFEHRVAHGEQLPEEARLPARANRLAARAYRPRPFPGKVLLLEEDEPGITEYRAPRMGWDGLLRGDVEAYAISGGRRGLLSEPAVRRTAAFIDEAWRCGI